MSTIEIGLIGTGGRAQTHCASLSEMSDVEITAVCDIEEERAVTTAEQFGVAHSFTDYHTLLEEADPDVVYVVTPPSAMDPIVPDVLRRGTDVYLEKPPGLQADWTRRWADIARENGCKTMVGLQRRFHPLAREAYERVTERSPILYGVSRFDKHWERGTPYLLGHGCHAIDPLVWMGGGIGDVHGFVGKLHIEREQYGPWVHPDNRVPDDNLHVAILEFENGGLGYLQANNTAGGRNATFEMHGSGISAVGEARGNPDSDRLVIQADGEHWEDAEVLRTEDVLDDSLPREMTHSTDYPWNPVYEGTFQISRHFLDCVKRDERPENDLEAAVDVMHVIDEIEANGRRILPALTE